MKCRGKYVLYRPVVSLADLFDNVRYMDLVLAGRVTESALLALAQVYYDVLC